VFLDDLNPDAIQVELYADGKNGEPASRHTMERGARLGAAGNAFVYRAGIATRRPPTDYTPRLIPHHEGAFVPLEAAFILWHDSPSWR
jgi:starch phosphorylase